MDQFINAYKDALSNYAKFDGRLSIGGYWRFFLVNIVISLVLFALANAAGIFFVLYAVYLLALFIPGLAAAVRRLHDTGKSGWMLLIAFIPLVGSIILIVFLASAGDTGGNEYGAPTA
jgi:uncharacterized membrane protein YhaH (DUF805 family)